MGAGVGDDVEEEDDGEDEEDEDDGRWLVGRECECEPSGAEVLTRGGLTLAFKWLISSRTTENLMTFSMSRRLRVISATVSGLMDRWKKM